MFTVGTAFNFEVTLSCSHRGLQACHLADALGKRDISRQNHQQAADMMSGSIAVQDTLVC